MKFRLTSDVVVEGGVAKITNTTIVPISEAPITDMDAPRGKQEPSTVPQPERKAPTPAPVGQTSSSGKGDWFKGTSWGN